MKLLFLVLVSIAYAIPKKALQIKAPTQPMNAQDMKVSNVDLALYQTEKQHLTSEVTNWAQAKATMLDQMATVYAHFELFLSRQQQIGIVLVCIICFAFYLMVKQEDRNLKQKKQHLRQHAKQPEITVQILTDSIMKQPEAVSTIIGSIQTYERVNKSADGHQIEKMSPPMQRSNSQPLIKVTLPDYSAEEINSLLKDINV